MDIRLGSRRWRGRKRGNTVAFVVAALVVWLCYRLLGVVWTIFDHAYLNSYLFVGGYSVNRAYWDAVRFAFRGTVFVAALAASIITLVVLQILRTRR